MTAFKQHGMNEKLVLCSGDVFGPSMEADMCRGENMAIIYKMLKCRASCLGNHETEYGLTRMQELIEMTGTPWLMANFKKNTGKAEGEMLDGCQKTHIIRYNGMKIGLVGICDKEWEGLMNVHKVQDDVYYEDMIRITKNMCNDLKAEGCQYIIALTHMKTSSDRILAKECHNYFDLILGGHDHLSVDEQVGSIRIIKSGTDFKEFSDIFIAKEDRKVTRTTVKITQSYEEDPEMKEKVDEWVKEIDEKLGFRCAYSCVKLESRFENVRARETNVGNWIADVIQTNFKENDIVLLNSGQIRSNKVFD